MGGLLTTAGLGPCGAVTLCPRGLSGPHLPACVTPRRQLEEGSSHAGTPAPGASVIWSREWGGSWAGRLLPLPRAPPATPGRPPVPGPPIAGLLPVAPSWQSLGSAALHPGAVTGRGAPCPSLQDSGRREARGRAALHAAGWVGQEANLGGG